MSEHLSREPPSACQGSTNRSPLEIQQWLRYLLFKLTNILGDILQLHKYTEAAILFPQAERLTSLPIVPL